MARAHLDRAIGRYEEALALAPDHLMARLGLGWCLVQAGDTSKATTVLRGVVARAWPADREPKGRLHDTVTEEAARYLIPLLDPARDKSELKRLRQPVAERQRAPRAITPIAVPLRDGLDAQDIIDHHADIRFDADALSSWRIAALSYAYQLDATHPEEIAVARTGVTFSDGSSRPTFDVVLHTR